MQLFHHATTVFIKPTSNIVFYDDKFLNLIFIELDIVEAGSYFDEQILSYQ